MNLEEIVSRDLSAPLEQEEALFVIKEYVKIRKEVVINPTIYVNQPTIFIVKQLQMMSQFALVAIMWLKINLKTKTYEEA